MPLLSLCPTCRVKRGIAKGTNECNTCHSYRWRTGRERPPHLTSKQVGLNAVNPRSELNWGERAILRFFDRMLSRGLGPSECWLFSKGSTDRGGYGLIQGGGKQHKAHRLAYEVTVGPIPDGYVIDHECHNEDFTCLGGRTCPHRACANPWHLKAVTRSDNGRTSNRRLRQTCIDSAGAAAAAG